MCCIRIEEIEAVMEKKIELAPAAPIGKACAWWIVHSSIINKTDLIWYNKMVSYTKVLLTDEPTSIKTLISWMYTPLFFSGNELRLLNGKLLQSD